MAADLTPYPALWTSNAGHTRLPLWQHVALAVRILRNHHAVDLLTRSRDLLGDRADRIGPMDMSRNLLRTWCERVGRAYDIPPMVSGFNPALSPVIGDSSATTTARRYATVDAAPMPTTAADASAEAQLYQLGAGYSAVKVGWSRRTGRESLHVVTPDHFWPEYASDDPSEPTIVRVKSSHRLRGELHNLLEVYDLTDLDNPSFRILDGDKDVTKAVLGRTFIGGDYLAVWSFSDGRPYHPVVVRGHPRHAFDRLQQVEASQIAPVRWTAWGSGTDFASHPGRNVRGLRQIGTSSNTGGGGSGISDGPEVIKQWADINDERPGDHWQDAPAFDPLTIAKAIGFYESLTLSLLDLPMQMEATGGEPTAREAEALESRIRATYTECRRFDAELLRRCAALANRLPEVEGSGFSEDRLGVLYRNEIAEALGAVTQESPDAPQEDDDQEDDGDDATDAGA